MKGADIGLQPSPFIPDRSKRYDALILDQALDVITRKF
jgi:hypothetical protein